MIVLVFLIIMFLTSFVHMKKSLSTYMYLLFSLSLIGTYFLSHSRFFDAGLGVWGVLYLCASLYLVISPWKYVNSTLLRKISITTFESKVYNVLKIIGVLSLVINIIVIYFLNGMVSDYSAFKNGGESTFYYQRLPIPGFLNMLVGYLSPLMIVLLPYHFYYLSKGLLKEGMLSLILSLNYILFGLATFSRSTSATFILIYMFCFLLFNKTLPVKIKKLYTIVLLSCLSLAIISLVVITLNRFSGDSQWVAESFFYEDTIIKDPVITSVLSYFSQWYIYGSKFIENYNGSTTQGVLSLPVLNLIMSRFFGLKYFSDQSVAKIVYDFYKDDTGAFMGVSSYMLNDLGLILTIFTLICYGKFIKKIRVKINSISSQMILVNLMIFPILGIFSSALHIISFHITFYLTILIYLLNKKSTTIG